MLYAYVNTEFVIISANNIYAYFWLIVIFIRKQIYKYKELLNSLRMCFDM